MKSLRLLAVVLLAVMTGCAATDFGTTQRALTAEADAHMLADLSTDDGPFRLLTRARWRAPADPTGRLVEPRDADPVPGLLAMGRKQLHFVPDGVPAGLHCLAIEYEHMVSVDDERGILMVEAIEGQKSAPQRHRFLISAHDDGSSGWPRDSTAMVQEVLLYQALLELIGPDRWVESVRIEVPPWQAELKYVLKAAEAADTRRGEPPAKDASRRIADHAMAAGIVTAMPCGVCQAGICPPQVLAPCAALFAVGATLGGIWAIGQELFSGGLKPAAPAQSAVVTMPAAPALSLPSLTAAPQTRSRLDQPALRQCLTRHLNDEAERVWRLQGRTAKLDWQPESVAPSVAAAPPSTDPSLSGRRYLTEISVTAVSLVGTPSTDPQVEVSSMPVRLKIDGKVRLIDPPSGQAQEEALSWQSAPLPLAQWNGPDTGAAYALLDEACTEVAKRALQAGRMMWQRQ